MKTNIDIDLAPFQGKKVLCAVSGGADSMCLLHALHSAGISVTAAHFEHGIRGEESKRDMDFVQSWCKDNSIPFVCGRAHVPAYAAEHSMGIEEAARLLRYDFLERQRIELGCDYIATAHNLDDNAETLLMHLIRGSGAKGLSGIPRQRGHIVRPLLDVCRRDIERYLRENAVPHVEDSTNQSEDYTRNLIRRRLMPVIAEINPGFNQAAMRTAALMQQDEQCLGDMAAAFLRENLRDNAIPCSALCAAPAAVSSRALRLALPGLDMEHVEALLSFAAAPGHGALSMPGRQIIRDAGLIYLQAPEHAALPDRPLPLDKWIILPECGLKVRAEITHYRGEVNGLFKNFYIKYEIICSDIYVTGRRAGDSLRPLGRGLSKTLKALFVEKKYPAHKRDCCPVIRDAEGPLLVWGIAVDERAAPGLNEKALKICFEEI